MKRQMTTSLVRTISAFVVMASLTATANAQQPQRFKTGTGVVTPPVGQTLRVTVATGDVTGDDTIRVRLGWKRYGTTTCSGVPAVCSHTVLSQGLTQVMTLNSTDAISFDVPGDGNGVNIVVESNSRNVKVLGIVFDTSTQRIMGIWHPFGDF